MRIAVAGTQCIGKTTLINDFLKEWPMYKRSGYTYREAVKKLNLPLNKQVTKSSQRMILECLKQDVAAAHKGDRIIFDRTPFDNAVYSLWSLGTQSSDIDVDFIKETAEIVKESMRNIDIIFFLPITKVSPVPVENRDMRETDLIYRTEIDYIFKALSMQASKGECKFFVREDAPPIIEIFGTPLERIEMIKLYVNAYGDCVDTTSSILSNENITMMETLLNEQKAAGVDEKELKALKDVIVKAKKMPPN